MDQRKSHPPKMTPKKWGFLKIFENRGGLAKNHSDRKLGDKLPVLSFFGMKKFYRLIGERQIFCWIAFTVI